MPSVFEEKNNHKAANGCKNTSPKAKTATPAMAMAYTQKFMVVPDSSFLSSPNNLAITLLRPIPKTHHLFHILSDKNLHPLC